MYRLCVANECWSYLALGRRFGVLDWETQGCCFELMVLLQNSVSWAKLFPWFCLLMPEVTVGELNPPSSTSSLCPYSNQISAHPSAASMGTSSVGSASATQAGKDLTEPRVPLPCLGTQRDAHTCPEDSAQAQSLSSAPTLLNVTPGEGTRVTALRPHPSTTKPASALEMWSHAQVGVNVSVGSVSATLRT